MLEDELKRICEVIARPISDPDRLNTAIDKILKSNSIDLENADEKVLPGAVMAALFDDMAKSCLEGACSSTIKNEVKKEYWNIKRFVPATW